MIALRVARQVLLQIGPGGLGVVAITPENQGAVSAVRFGLVQPLVLRVDVPEGRSFRLETPLPQDLPSPADLPALHR